MPQKKEEGALYKIATIEGVRFEIRYGFQNGAERERWEPIPIYPDFIAAPQYTPDGSPFVTAYQDICEYYQPKQRVTGENWCADCMLFHKQETYIGICTCENRRKEPADNINISNGGIE